jgi:hypothetical protein
LTTKKTAQALVRLAEKMERGVYQSQLAATSVRMFERCRRDPRNGRRLQ